MYTATGELLGHHNKGAAITSIGSACHCVVQVHVAPHHFDQNGYIWGVAVELIGCMFPSLDILDDMLVWAIHPSNNGVKSGIQSLWPPWDGV